MELTSPRRQEKRYLKQPVFSFSMQHLGKSDVLFRYEKLYSGNPPKCNIHCFVDTSANNFAMKAKRKTLNAGDVMSAMEEMEFERFLQPLREALEGKWLFFFFLFFFFFKAKSKCKGKHASDVTFMNESLYLFIYRYFSFTEIPPSTAARAISSVDRFIPSKND